MKMDGKIKTEFNASNNFGDRFSLSGERMNETRE